jgi:hypothetical protein
LRFARLIAGRAGRLRRHASKFKVLQHGVEAWIVTPFFDQPAGMRGRRTVAAEHPTDLTESRPEAHTRQIHRNLARKRSRGRSAARRQKLGRWNGKARGHQSHERIAIPRRRGMAGSVDRCGRR